MTSDTQPIRVLIGKPGLDGHDVGAKLVGRALADAGMEVRYTGLRQSPDAIANRADIVGLSILSGTHLTLTKNVLAALEEHGVGKLPVMVGGVIPVQDHATLMDLGIAGVFPVGTPFEEIVDFVRTRVRR